MKVLNLTDLFPEVEEERLAEADNMTLGALIDALKGADPEKQVITSGGTGVNGLDSYRGYYNDLAFKPCTKTRMTVGELLKMAESVNGKVCVGYKGGDYVMSRSTILWISNYGEASGIGLIGITEYDFMLVLHGAYCE